LNIPFYHFVLFAFSNNKLPELSSEKILIVLSEEESSLENLSLLDNILKAIKVEKEFCCVLSLKKEDYYPIAKTLISAPPLKILIFGDLLPQLGLNFNFDNYKPYTLKSVQITLSKPLSILQQDKIEKKNLWTALQRIFLESV